MLCTLLFIYSFPVQQTRQFVCEFFLTLCKSRFHLFFVRFLFLAFVCNFFWRARPPIFGYRFRLCLCFGNMSTVFDGFVPAPSFSAFGRCYLPSRQSVYYFVGRFVCLSFSYLVSFFVLVSRALKFKSF